MIHTGPSSDSVSLQEEVHKSIVGKTVQPKGSLMLSHILPLAVSSSLLWLEFRLRCLPHKTIPSVLMHQGTERAVVNFLMNLVAGTHRTRGLHETGGVPPKPPATILLSVWSQVFWDFGSLQQRRCGVISYALSRRPYCSSMSLRRRRLRVAAQASRTSHSRCFCNSRS